jgi:hypothetical protein
LGVGAMCCINEMERGFLGVKTYCSRDDEQEESKEEERGGVGLRSRLSQPPIMMRACRQRLRCFALDIIRMYRS